jgi:GTPase SAR1 family protein
MRVVIVGPCKTGKSRIANALSGIEPLVSSQTYRPTVAARILNFEIEPENSVTIYDTSGDPSYIRLIPAFCTQPAVLLVVLPSDQLFTVEGIEKYTKETCVSPDDSLLIFVGSTKAKFTSFPSIARVSIELDGTDTAEMKHAVVDWLRQHIM